MTAEDLLNAYRDEMAPTLGRAFIEGFIARNRNSMLRMLAPLVALMNERMQAPRVSEYEDPDEVTPEKDAIVWAAFNQLVEEKRRQLNIQPDKPVSGKARKTRAKQSAAPVVAKTREILHEMDADDAKYRLPPRTESLPSPKHAGRMGDGFNVGEHVIRIGDMIKMEGQLGGYVASVDRSKGIARIEQDNGEIKTWPLASLLHDTAANRERQQEHNNQINAEAEARLEQSLADWRAR